MIEITFSFFNKKKHNCKSQKILVFLWSYFQLDPLQKVKEAFLNLTPDIWKQETTTACIIIKAQSKGYYFTLKHRAVSSWPKANTKRKSTYLETRFNNAHKTSLPPNRKTTNCFKRLQIQCLKIPQVSRGTDRVCFGSHLLADEQASVQETFYHGDKGSGQRLFIPHAAPLPV